MTNPSCQSREKKEENNDTGLFDLGKGAVIFELSIKLLGRLLDHFFLFPGTTCSIRRVTIDRHNLVNQSLINRLALTAIMHVQYK